MIGKSGIDSLPCEVWFSFLPPVFLQEVSVPTFHYERFPQSRTYTVPALRPYPARRSSENQGRQDTRDGRSHRDDNFDLDRKDFHLSSVSLDF